MDGRPLCLLEDIASAAEQLSPLGRALLHQDLSDLRGRLSTLSATHGWDVVDHGVFRRWTAERLGPCREVFVLDKLLSAPSGEDGRRYHRVRAHRALGPDGRLVLRLDWGDDVLLQRLPGARVAVVDDAAYTGGTLCAIVDLLSDLNAGKPRLLVAATTERARRTLARRGVALDAWLSTPVLGDVIHARDAYPWLPHSGRASVAPSTEVPPRRVSALLHDRGAWLSHPALAHDPLLRKLATAAVDRLRTHLGREPVVTDLVLLGRDVAAPLADDTAVDDSAPLRSLLPW